MVICAENRPIVFWCLMRRRSLVLSHARERNDSFYCNLLADLCSYASNDKHLKGDELTPRFSCSAEACALLPVEEELSEGLFLLHRFPLAVHQLKMTPVIAFRAANSAGRKIP